MADDKVTFKMLKYPAPWQVLCSGLERREQVLLNEEAKTLSDELGSSQPDGQTEYADTSEVISNQINNKDSLIQYTLTVFDQQVPSDDSVVSEPTMDRVTRSLIFSLSSSGNKDTLNEESKLETSTTDEHNESADEKNKSRQDSDRTLILLKEDQRFGVRAYLPETSPTKLFADDVHDDGQPRSSEFTSHKAKELERERRAIIKRQGQRKSLDVDEIISIQQDVVNATSSTIDHNGLDSDDDKMNVDTDQINFEAARKQFLQLEKKQNTLPISSQRQSKTPRHNYRSNENDKSREIHEMTNNLKVSPEVKTPLTESTKALEVNGRERSSSQLRKQFFSGLAVDDRDSGSKATSKEENEVARSPEIPLESAYITIPKNETPIEREIRLALEREESLRKERGIQIVGENKEMVEIVKNPALLQASETQTFKKSKERSRSVIFLQREIEKEAKREEDLKSEGKVAGLYDKGSVQELDERRKVFEQLDDVPVQPQSMKKISKTGTIDLDTNDNITQVDSKPQLDFERTNWTVLDATRFYSNASTTSKPTQLNTTRARRQSADNILDFNRPKHYSSEKDQSSEQNVLRKENFHIQPWKFHLQVRTEEDTKQSPKWTARTYDDSNPETLYNTTRLRPLTKNLIEKEIQETLERDRELQEQRRKSDGSSLGTSMINKPTSQSDKSSRWPPAVPRGSQADLASSDNASALHVFKPRKVPMFFATDSSKSMRTGDEYQYAGINPSDNVNSEIVESTRVNRHKNRMAVLWEAGHYANNASE